MVKQLRKRQAESAWAWPRWEAFEPVCLMYGHGILGDSLREEHAMGTISRRTRRRLADGVSDHLQTQPDPGFLPLAYGIELPEDELGHPDSPVRIQFMMRLRRSLLFVSDEDLIGLAEDALEGDEKAEALVETARAEMAAEDEPS